MSLGESMKRIPTTLLVLLFAAQAVPIQHVSAQHLPVQYRPGDFVPDPAVTYRETSPDISVGEWLFSGHEAQTVQISRYGQTMPLTTILSGEVIVTTNHMDMIADVAVIDRQTGVSTLIGERVQIFMPDPVRHKNPVQEPDLHVDWPWNTTDYACRDRKVTRNGFSTGYPKVSMCVNGSEVALDCTSGSLVVSITPMAPYCENNA